MDTSDRPLEEVEFVAFDLETTGLYAVACRIVEFGAVRFRLNGTELGRFEQLVDPECPIPPQAMRIHGITDAMFLGSPDTILLAHNATFDLGFLGVALTKLGQAFPPHAVVDTLDLEHVVRRLGAGLAGQDRPDIRTVQLTVGRRAAAGQFHKGRQNVHHPGHGVGLGAGRDFAGPPGDGGYAHAAFERASLVTAERRIDGPLRAAVVRREDYQRAGTEL
jgi:hypothetical protein